MLLLILTRQSHMPINVPRQECPPVSCFPALRDLQTIRQEMITCPDHLIVSVSHIRTTG
jgi:hypothetical protein